MSSIDRNFRLARRVALKGDSKDATRQFRLGAVGIRSDGAVVTASNVPNRHPEPNAHAETRVTKKLDWGSTVYVIRLHADGTLATARPCKKCQSAMRLRGVKYCYYSISENDWGRLTLT